MSSVQHEFSVGSLFSGIGGLDLGLERAGWDVQWQVENNDFCNCVLKKHWPDVKRFGDIKTLDDKVGAVDLVCGGFPCQPVSVAGRRKGQEDARWLWPEFTRILGLVRPRLILVENTPGLLSLGMGAVLGSLAALGYDAEWDSLPAAAFGAPHLRYRVFLVGYPQRCRFDWIAWRRARTLAENGCQKMADTEGESSWNDGADFGSSAREEHASFNAGLAGGAENVANAACRSAWCAENRAVEGNGSPGSAGGCRCDCGDGSHADGAGLPLGIFSALATQSGESQLERLRESGGKWWPAKCRLGLHLNGISAGLDCGGWECGIPRVTRKQANREERLRALGNAVVPAVAEWIGWRLREIAEQMSGLQRQVGCYEDSEPVRQQRRVCQMWLSAHNQQSAFQAEVTA